jgi:phosphohistidine phosphatase
MKNLFLLRHASAENASCRVNDLNRRLSPAGRDEATALGRFVHSRKLSFDKVICSAATRARETMSLVLGKTSQASFDQRVYEAGATELLDLLRELGAGVNSALLVGHNPSLEQLVYFTTGTMVSMAPATLVKLNLSEKEWSSLEESAATVDWLVRATDV